MNDVQHNPSPVARSQEAARLSTPKRLLVLSAYPEECASPRFRACQFFPHLRAANYEINFRPFLGTRLFQKLYSQGGTFEKALGLVASTARSLGLLVARNRYDAVFVQRQAALIGPEVIETFYARGLRVPLIFDVDDAIWIHEPAANGQNQSHHHPLAARLLKNSGKADRLLRLANQVVVGSQHLAKHARTMAANVTVVPTVVSRAEWSPLPRRLQGNFVSDSDATIGWVGTHSTAKSLDVVVPALTRLASEGFRFRLRLVGASRDLKINGVEVLNDPWVLEREVQDFQRIDIGIAPMFEDAWAEGKCGFKQLQYMAVGVPHVCTVAGGARDFVRHGENALVATNMDSWYTHLRALLSDQALRARLASGGRTLVEKEYCTEAQAPRLAAVIERAMSC